MTNSPRRNECTIDYWRRKAKNTGIPVVFAVGVFDVKPKHLAGEVFVADKNAEDRYKEAVRYMATRSVAKKISRRKNTKSQSRLLIRCG